MCKRRLAPGRQFFTVPVPHWPPASCTFWPPVGEHMHAHTHMLMLMMMMMMRRRHVRRSREEVVRRGRGELPARHFGFLVSRPVRRNESSSADATDRKCLVLPVRFAQVLLPRQQRQAASAAEDDPARYEKQDHLPGDRRRPSAQRPKLTSRLGILLNVTRSGMRLPVGLLHATRRLGSATFKREVSRAYAAGRHETKRAIL